MPKHFSEHDPQKVFEVIEKNPLATIITSAAEVENLQVNFLPVIPLKDPSTPHGFKLTGHMSRANQHWKLMQANPQTMVLFHGPHAYITPKWFTESKVPTWNYLAVHLWGKAKLIESGVGITDILRREAATFEDPQDPWNFFVESEFHGGILEKRIVGFEITPEKIECKFKLNQNRSDVDYQGVIAGLATRTDENSRLIREEMQRRL